MWKRNLLFIVLCLTGLGWIGSNLLRRDRIETPKHFWEQRLQQDDIGRVIEQVNAEFRAAWQAAGIEPAQRAEPLTMARRISLGLAGTIPSLEELRETEKLSAAVVVEWWTSRMLEDRRFADNIAERLTRSYVGVENGPFLIYRRRRFTTWLSDRLLENDMHYNRIVRELISDTGLWTDKPAVNFVSVTVDNDGTKQPDPIRLAARTSRAFLGMRIDCLQCHDDKLDKVTLGTQAKPRSGTQQDFHQLVAFFSDVEATALGIQDIKKNYSFKFLGQTAEQDVLPEVPFAETMRSGHGSKRQQLANWVTHADNKPFARATVNRFWAFIFGRPLVDPIDDIPLFGPFPPGLETLAEDFARHDFDQRRLIRVLTALDVFQRESRADFEITKQHEDLWAVFPLTRLRPDQFAGSVVQAASLKTIDANSHIIFQLAKFGQQREFIERYGDTGEDEFVDRGGTIPQRLLVMNGQLVREKCKADELFTAVGRIYSQSSSNSHAIETVYLTILSRKPTANETQVLVKRLDDVRGNTRKRALEDVCWMLMNSTEFAWNH